MRQHVDFISAPHGEGIIIERDVPQQNFMFPFHARAAQKRLDVEQKLFAIKRRGQKIVYARAERLLAVGGDSWLVNIKMRGSLPTLCSVWVNSSRSYRHTKGDDYQVGMPAFHPADGILSIGGQRNRIVPGFQQVARFLPPALSYPATRM